MMSVLVYKVNKCVNFGVSDVLVDFLMCFRRLRSEKLSKLEMELSKHLLLLLLASIVLCVTSGSRKEKDRKKDRYRAYLSTNPCKSENPDTPIQCFCNPDSSPGNATKIECWVFGKSLTPEYSIWNHFANQPRITDMKAQVRPNGVFNFIPTKAIAHLRNLRNFEVIYGSIEEIHPYAFANLSSLQVLSLTRNQIVNLSNHAFAHLPNLTELHLDDNRISELRRDVFVDLPSLQKFYLPNNNLSVIQEQTFRQLSHLLELELNSNYITVLTKDVFTGLSELKRLDLMNNSISMLGDLTFAELWVLEELILEANQIMYIADRAFAGLTHLKHLNLADNRLSTLSPNLLEDLQAVTHLDLRGNKLQTLTSENIHRFVNNLYNITSFLNLSNNKLVCDCRLSWMYGLKNVTKSQQIKDALDELKCFGNKSSHLKRGMTTTTVTPDPFDKSYFYTPVYEDYSDDVYNNQADDDVYSRRQILHLMAIQEKDLPCPKPEEPTEAPYNFRNVHTYAEINSGAATLKFALSQCLIIVLWRLT